MKKVVQMRADITGLQKNRSIFPERDINFHMINISGVDEQSIITFSEKLKDSDLWPLKAQSVSTLQINITKQCNLSCEHCHQKAGPDRKEMMSWNTLEKCLKLAQSPEITTIDITGGAPEMNPHIEWFISQASIMGKRLIVRSNLAILDDPFYSHLLDIYNKTNIEIVGSLPCYNSFNVDTIRGKGTFEKIIKVFKILNNFGYGLEGTGKIINIMYNPVGTGLPGPQKTVEQDFRINLFQKYGIRFNGFFTMTNIPIGRYLDYLMNTDNYDNYMSTLYNSYNPDAVINAMCRYLISVGCDGTLYDCDFNQAMSMPVMDCGSDNIDNVEFAALNKRKIVVGNHCYACTSQNGSSCLGATCH